MKLNKIFAVALAVLAMTSCDDNKAEDYPAFLGGINTEEGVIVDMKDAEVSMSEDFTGNNYGYIPVVLTGAKANGTVTVTVAVEEVGENPAVEGQDYVFTSKTINIPAGETEGYFELHAAGDDVENPDRTFKVTIVSAEGAKVGNLASAQVSLLDNERLLPEAYAKVLGLWSSSSSSKGTYTCEFVGYPKGHEKYLKAVKVSGFCGVFDVDFGFTFDSSTGNIGFKFVMPQVVAENAQFNVGVADLICLPMIDGSLYLSGTLMAEFDPTGDTFTFDGGAAVGLFTPGNHSSSGFMGYVSDRVETIEFQKL